jgi:hypothetical protein
MVFHETNKLSSNITWGHSKTLNVIPYLYLIFKVELLVTENHLLNLSMKGWNSVFNAQGSKIYTINSLRSSVTELGSVTKSWPGPAQHSRTLGFPPTGSVVGGVGPGLSQKVDRARPDTPHGCDEARCKRVVCVWRGRAMVAGAEVSWMSSASYLFCSRGQRLLGIGNSE